MLDYLDYESEAEFVTAIGGLIKNCVHPEDREKVSCELKDQLAQGDDYQVTYRMLKKMAVLSGSIIKEELRHCPMEEGPSIVSAWILPAHRG